MKGQKLIAKILTGFLFAVLIFSFAIWGIGDIFRGGGSAYSIAAVGDVEIDQQEFARDFSREINQTSQRLGTRLTIEQAQTFGLVAQVLDRSINRAVFEQQADDLRLMVTEEQIQRQIIDTPSFKDEFGQFSANRFNRVLQTNGLSEAGYVALLRRDTERQQIANAVTEAVQAPTKLAEQLYAYEQEKRVGQYLVIPTRNITEIPEPNSLQIQQFYDDNDSNFMAPETRAITLFQLRPDDLAAEITIDEDTLRDEFEARREDFTVPEKRTIEQIVFAEQAEAQAASDRLQEGADFAALAQELTDRAPVSLGTLQQDELLPALGEPVFALAQGIPSAPIESAVGWHVVLVTAIEAGEEPEFEALREELQRDAALNEAIENIIELANQFDDEVAGGASLEEAAARLSLPVQEIPAIDRQGRDAEGTAVEKLPPQGEFLPLVFQTEAGDTSLLTETADGGYFAVRVDSITPEAKRPLDEVRDNAVLFWTEAERVRLADELAQEMLALAENGGDFAAIATSYDLEVQTTEPITRDERSPARSPSPQLSSALFRLAVGDYAMTTGPEGQIIVRLEEIQAAELADDNAELDRVRDRLSDVIQNDLLDQYLAALRNDYGVTINETLLQQTIDSF